MSGKYRRDSQVVNNFFTLVSIVIIAIVITLYSKYGPKVKTPSRVHSNLECQKTTSTIDKITSPSLLKDAKYYMENGLYVLNGGFIKPRFGKFYLKDEITIEEANDFFKLKIAIVQKENPVKYLNIKYEIIENDKNDPRKKDAYSKSYAGTILSSFRINGKEAFMMKTDFLEYDKKDIKNRIDCIIEAFKHNAK
ncbi:MAG: hypothetical protein C0626_09975 [Arcobacter sp.]|uniref:hypothetical protein n=1 Tax=uncultured Arcobacter sp. TaxID=165434 RepID=UPI000CB33551|nr:hypothetical protein [uncultured Arcobacter sp.]PLY09311.1 MAG: hypothetical protein C0626_09975 [Arcobacter sp.]